MTGYQDWVNGITSGCGLLPINRTATATGTTFDTALTDGQLALFLSGTVNVGTVAITFVESDDDSTYTAVALATGTTLTTAFVLSTQKYNVYPTKRYVRAVFTGASSPDFSLGAVWFGRTKYVGS